MTITLLQAPVGAGKTEAILNQLAQLLAKDEDRKPFARVWVLLATRRQEVAFRQRLVQLLDGQPSLFNIEFFNFYDLYRRLLNMAGKPQRHLQEAGRRGLLRHVIQTLDDDGDLQQFHPIASQSGFISVIADFIAELKQNHVKPEVFLQAARAQATSTQVAGTQKDAELAAIYARYQEVLQGYSLVDPEGEGWLACVELEEQLARGTTTLSSVDLLVVDGYDQFTPVQTNILALLGKHITTYITLTRLPVNAEGHTPPVGRRFEQTYHRLKQALAEFGAKFEDGVLIEPQNRDPELQYLSVALGGQALPTEDYVPSHVHLIEAPDMATEIAALLRRVKELLLAKHPARPDDILIVLRDQAYQPYVEAYARLYRIPLLAHTVKSIATNPAVTLLIDALKLSNQHFPRRETLDVLRSPYLHLPNVTPELLTKLETITLERRVLDGAKNWLEAIRDAIEDVDQLNGDEDEDKHLLKLTDAESDALSSALESFFSLVTPPEEDSLRHYVLWLENLIGSSDQLEEDGDTDFSDSIEKDIAERMSLHIVYQIHQLAREEDPWLTARDIQALNTLKDILRGLLQTQDLLYAIDPALSYNLTRWDDLFVDLMQMIKSSQEPQRSPVRTGRVLVTGVTDARGLPHQHIFIPGLAEGVFPAPVAEDPLYLDTERQSLSQRGVRLDPRFERAADHSLFYEIVSQAHGSLTLSRPTARDGKPWPASHLWRMIQHIFPDLKPHTIRTDDGIAPHDAASAEEVLLAIAHAVQTNTVTADTISLAAWLSESDLGDAWDGMRHSSAIETGRTVGGGRSEYNGIIIQPIIATTIRDVVSRWRWSANRFKSYGECGYKFFAHYFLSLDALEEPEAGVNAMIRGRLHHKILELVYDHFRIRKLAITPAQHDDALKLLDKYAKEVFETAPKDYGFIPPTQWENEQKHYMTQLHAFVSRDFSAESPLNKFGERRVPLALEYTFSNLSVMLNSRLTRVTGTIDRIDFDAQSQTLIIVDYKSSSMPGKADMEKGSNLQMLIYAKALAEIAQQEGWTGTIRAAVFWGIANNETKIFDFEKDDIHDAMIKGEGHAQDHIIGVENGQFPIRPKVKTACDYCDFKGGLCRIAQRAAVTNQASPEQ